MIKAVYCVRCLATLGLVYGAYTETGIYTAVCLVLLFVSTELLTFNLRERDK